ncbi:MAG TPA: imidazole glycerol phosphate synthase subunit HisH [Rhodocyclaceae bacterium]|nr:imidazole glycerol phosphate synthase subunit HisH [Rhodocyclaceae bacterium]HMV53347.1 imidazole glycerol phosphate synthase subunit HisH [Rhodocyclaceae bacterium]HMZ83022.1 imidazole glycerol phosphate synthase subunit HisH [Rhodocyclaceae bacterium]HNA03126.1 imidazole glycerol phosphate synthase subunit HisH [Rhodocyclaceae bacterium]HNB78436.1 imidazole glycerol phosphate synthase subunit HisH [Rhodocyclaceae bacterium]
MNTVAIVDYGMGNLRSVAKAIEHVAPEACILVTHDPAAVAAADRVVVPGQGAMPDCMRELEMRGLRGAVVAAAAAKPFLGICIGLQMLFESSEEGNVSGLGIFPGNVRRFPAPAMVGADGTRLKVPHMGWNQVRQSREHALWQGIADLERFYFVHSYYVVPDDPGLAAGRTNYGVDFTAAVAQDNIFAVQFHPEKSAQAGLALLGNFMRWKP